MPREDLIVSHEFPYHVTGRANNREQFPGRQADLWKIFSSELIDISQKFNSRIHAFVLMPNHFHLMISTPKEDLGVTMQRFMAQITRKINRSTNRSGRIFGAKYYRSLINTEAYYDCALKYVYRNPVKAGLCFRVEDYPFSSFSGLFNPRDISFRLEPPQGHVELIPYGKPLEFLAWMNQPLTSEQDIEIRKAFRGPIFNPTMLASHRFQP